ncbi:MAG: hypothetical protein IJO08_04435 [Clostridia bacterium]|nr:hypothetical protein [Clostridia bacterium]
MKKIFLALLLVVCVFALVACGNNDEALENNDVETVDSGEELEIVKDFEAVEIPDDEKVTYIILEGLKEPVNYVGVKSALGYVLQYDPDIFAISKDGSKDLYASIDNEDVYFTIEILAEGEGVKGEREEAIIDGYEVYREMFLNGEKVDTIIADKFDDVITNNFYVKTPEKTFKLTTNYTMDCLEGFGYRILNMLGTFKAQ